MIYTENIVCFYIIICINIELYGYKSAALFYNNIIILY